MAGLSNTTVMPEAKNLRQSENSTIGARRLQVLRALPVSWGSRFRALDIWGVRRLPSWGFFRVIHAGKGVVLLSPPPILQPTRLAYPFRASGGLACGE